MINFEKNEKYDSEWLLAKILLFDIGFFVHFNMDVVDLFALLEEIATLKFRDLYICSQSSYTNKQGSCVQVNYPETIWEWLTID